MAQMQKRYVVRHNFHWQVIDRPEPGKRYRPVIAEFYDWDKAKEQAKWFAKVLNELKETKGLLATG